MLRNLRNMQQAGVKEEFIYSALRDMKTDRVLRFRFLASARHVFQRVAVSPFVTLST